MYTEFMKKKVFELLALAAASPARSRHGRQKLSIPGCSKCSCSCVETLVMLRAKFHVVSSLLNVLKIELLVPLYLCP